MATAPRLRATCASSTTAPEPGQHVHRWTDAQLVGPMVLVSAATMRRFEVGAEDERLLERYLKYAAAVDGYAATTIVQRRTALRCFLAWLRAQGGDLEGVDVEVVHAFLIAEEQAGSAARSREIALLALRAFLACHRDPARGTGRAAHR